MFKLINRISCVVNPNAYLIEDSLCFKGGQRLFPVSVSKDTIEKSKMELGIAK